MVYIGGIYELITFGYLKVVLLLNCLLIELVVDSVFSQSIKVSGRPLFPILKRMKPSGFILFFLSNF